MGEEGVGVAKQSLCGSILEVIRVPIVGEYSCLGDGRREHVAIG